MTPTVLLFDIDGTLLSSSGAGRRAMEAALHDHTGREDLCRFGFDGMTDRAIVRMALAAAGHAAPALALLDAVLDTYVARLRHELAEPGDYHLYPGIAPALEAARGRAGVALGLGTGNIRRGATLKLGRVGLDSYFAFGGFGCDHEERPRIIGTGAERGAARLGRALRECRVVVIGDTPKDVAAARGIGARAVGVGTGSYQAADLAACGADRVFATLADEGVRESLFED